VIKKQKNGLNKNVFLWVGSQGFKLRGAAIGCTCSKKGQNKTNDHENEASGSESEDENKENEHEINVI
jgi:hypothetical protein